MAAFSFDQPCMDWNAKDLFQEYRRFREQVEFVFKGPLSQQKPADRAGWLGLWIGQHGREIYKTFTWLSGEKEDPEVVLQKFEDYVLPQRNKRIARFQFNRRSQLDGETFDNFVKDLRLLAMECDFTDSDDLLVDALIRGVFHKKVQE